jgi:hypothetical protein
MDNDVAVQSLFYCCIAGLDSIMHSHWIKPVCIQSVSSHLLEKAILFLRASKDFTDFTPASCR